MWLRIWWKRLLFRRVISSDNQKIIRWWYLWQIIGILCWYYSLWTILFGKYGNNLLCDQKRGFGPINYIKHFWNFNMRVHVDKVRSHIYRKCICFHKKVNQNGSVISTSTYNVLLIERTLYEGYCSLEYSTEPSWMTTFQFNLSNNRIYYSERHTVYIYQSVCQTLHNVSGYIYSSLQVCSVFEISLWERVFVKRSKAVDFVHLKNCINHFLF